MQYILRDYQNKAVESALKHFDKEKCLVIDITDNVKRMGRIETIKLEKEDGGFKDIVTTEVGEITNKPLFQFKLKDQNKINQILKNTGT